MVDKMIEIHHQDGKARTGLLHLPKGPVETPAFMPVGTAGTVKAVHHDTVAAMGYRLILGNTYHLFLRPGTEVLQSAGGLHKFSHWNHNILTDSGGFQVFSLAPFRKITEEGVKFRSHIDGAYHLLTPERVVEIQEVIGSDILMPLDVCTSPDIPYKKAKEALEITTRWLGRTVKRWQDRKQGWDGRLFGIIQGNFFADLRRRSAEEILALDTPGIAIGGLSVGESRAQFEEFLGVVAEMLPEHKPRYVMGIGTPDLILSAVDAGIDIFDCVYPTRVARNGAALTKSGLISLKKQTFEKDMGPLEEGCTCQACRNYSRAYLRHLFKAGEILGPMLATEHNLMFMYRFMEDLRASIREGRFQKFKQDFLAVFEGKSQ